MYSPNTDKVMTAFEQGRSAQAGNLGADPVGIYHYGTCLLARDTDGALYRNITHYSNVTTRVQAAIEDKFGALRTKTVQAIPTGATANDLLQIAKFRKAVADRYTEEAAPSPDERKVCSRALLIAKTQEKYGDRHPYYNRSDWREAVETESTLLGYWEWVVERLDEETEQAIRAAELIAEGN